MSLGTFYDAKLNDLIMLLRLGVVEREPKPAILEDDTKLVSIADRSPYAEKLPRHSWFVIVGTSAINSTLVSGRDTTE